MDNATERTWLRLDDLLRAEEKEQRAERALWKLTREAFPPAPPSAPSTIRHKQRPRHP